MNIEEQVEAFIARWTASSASEESNFKPSMPELCDLLGVPRPDPTHEDNARNVYVFERAVKIRQADGSLSSGKIDLWREGCFVLEAKQGGTGKSGKASKKGTATRGTAGWDAAMERAREQAERYAKAMSPTHGWVPFLIVLDVGHSIELYADFSRAGHGYTAFPKAGEHRFSMQDLRKQEVRELLRDVWLRPLELDPSRRAEKVTREVSAKLGQIARQLEQAQHDPEKVAAFLQRVLFTMFAEDVGLLPQKAFQKLLEAHKKDPRKAAQVIKALWGDMDRGGFSGVIAEEVLRFNGALFKDQEVVELDTHHIEALIEAAKYDWSKVEPAIFGTLLERALDPHERAKLGAHYTPRAFVERLVVPTVIQPLREEWKAAQAAVIALHNAGKTKEAQAQLAAFLKRLAEVKILDPACGSGNFLYVALDLLKRLEAEVLDFGVRLGVTQTALQTEGFTVSPKNCLGLELNQRAARIAELVLWIGHLQHLIRAVGGKAERLPQPLLYAYRNVEARDAVLEWDAQRQKLDEAGQPVTIWDQRSYKPHPVTGELVPDERAQIPVFEYDNPRPAKWPQADFIIGNPPFVGNKRMRFALGDGYTEALRAAYPSIGSEVDLVMYWWDVAARLTRTGQVRRFGFITTNSITQTSNRKIAGRHISAKPALRLVWAIPDHPWVQDGAAVRIAMTVGEAASHKGSATVGRVVSEKDTLGEQALDQVVVLEYRDAPTIHADLKAGANVAGAVRLRSNMGLSFQGMNLVGEGFRISEENAKKLNPDIDVLKEYTNAKDLTQAGKKRFVIDFHGLDSNKAKELYPDLYQIILEKVKPERDHNKRKSYREKWWIFGESRGKLRFTIKDIEKFILTPETSKHGIFEKRDSNIIADHSVYVIAINDTFALGVLSSRIHRVWALAAGSRLGVGNDPRWRNLTCFDPFPFPDASQAQREVIGALADKLDAHRKRVQGAHADAYLTAQYNALERVREAERGGKALTEKEREFHTRALIGILKELHDSLDAAVAQAYGWPINLSDEEILERLVKLNAERAEEEAKGHVRWLRPEFQAPQTQQAAQQAMDVGEEDGEEDEAATLIPWPKEPKEQVRALRQRLQESPATLKTLAAGFKGAGEATIRPLLDILVELGQAQELEEGRFSV